MKRILCSGSNILGKKFNSHLIQRCIVTLGIYYNNML